MNPEIERRRTFAIISHPDAGKTTLTEKLLLFGGQIQVAGAVKSNKIRKTATSDWMDIEKQRGISVTTSVMEFDYQVAPPTAPEGASMPLSAEGKGIVSPSGDEGGANPIYKVNSVSAKQSRRNQVLVFIKPLNANTILFLHFSVPEYVFCSCCFIILSL